MGWVIIGSRGVPGDRLSTGLTKFVFVVISAVCCCTAVCSADPRPVHRAVLSVQSGFGPGAISTGGTFVEIDLKPLAYLPDW